MAASSEIRVRILQLGRQVIDHRGHIGQTVAEALTATGLQIGPGMDLRVNGAPADGDSPLRDGDVVTIIPRIKGGRAHDACRSFHREGFQGGHSVRGGNRQQGLARQQPE